MEKLVAEYRGGFELAKINVDQEQQVAAALQVRSVPMVYLVKDGQLVDGFPGAKPETQVREFLTKHGILPARSAAFREDTPAIPLDPEAEVERLRQALVAEPENNDLKLDLALALLKTNGADEAAGLIDALPAKLATDDRMLRAKAWLRFIEVLNGAPSLDVLQGRVRRTHRILINVTCLGCIYCLMGSVRRRWSIFGDAAPESRLQGWVAT